MLKGTEKCVRLPKDRWPRNGSVSARTLWSDYISHSTGIQIVVVFWEQYCEMMLKEMGFELVFPAAWPSVFYHSGLGLLLAASRVCR